MLFTQPIFFAFFALVFAAFWLEKHHRRRKLWLLIASYLFYAAWDGRFLILIVASTAVDYWVGRALPHISSPSTRRVWLYLSVGFNLGILGFFKYFNFFIEQASGLLALFGIRFEDPALHIILPVGISFYTFQTLSYSYTIDVYRRRLEPVESPLDFALFVGFFPQLVAGPIVRAADFLPQLRSSPRWQTVAVERCSWLFLIGFVKKACIADQVAPYVDRVFAHPELYTAGSMWIAVLLYAIQIYGDFSGYSDMAIACAGLLGYDLGRNFAFPYLASSLSDFWRRWHISLSSWLRDYLYIPLGGGRGPRWRVHRNLLLTMVLGGLWHGAAWTFVLWGAWHGLALIGHRVWQQARPASDSPWRRAGGTLSTLYCVLIGWIFFRAQNLGDIVVLLKGFIFFQDSGPLTLDPRLSMWIVVLTPLHWLGSRTPLDLRLAALPRWSFACAYGAAAALALAFVPLRSAPFIYFQF